jgi:BD-FAE protein
MEDFLGAMPILVFHYWIFTGAFMNTRFRFAAAAGFAAILLFAAQVHSAAAQQAKQKQKGEAKPPADIANVPYGPHERNVMDVWKAKSDRPTPLLVFIHGGGFRGGSKEALQPYLLNGCLASGISVAAINYRLSPEVHFPAHYMDSARAIQFARTKASEWNLDPQRVAASGGSAGAGTSLWLGFHDDMADPKSDDPVLRQSTRLACMVVFGAQSTYDPRVIKTLVGGRAHEHPALPGFYGLKPEEFETEKAYKLYEAASAINYLTKDDPPVYAHYNEARVLPANPKEGQGIHSIKFGTYLKEKMDALGIECIVRHDDEKPDLPNETIAFLNKHLGVAK